MMLLPLVFITVIAHFKVGLVIYWVTTNLWTVGQGLVTRRLVPRTAAAPDRCHEALVAGARRPRTGARTNGSKARRRPRRSRSRPAGPAPPGEAEQGHTAAEVSAERTVEATGETVAEAKWRALRELELARPGARQGRGSLPGALRGRAGPARRRVHAGPGRSRRSDATEAVERASRRAPRRERQAAARSASCSPRSPPRSASAAAIEVTRSRRRSSATCIGDELGLLIGRHGQTIDAVQVLAAAIVGGRRGPARGRRRRRGVPRAPAPDARGDRRCAAPSRCCGPAARSSSSR